MINDMIEVLRSEFAQDVPTTEQTLIEWQQSPLEPPPGVTDMLSLQERFILAAESIGLPGLSAFLARVRDVTLSLAFPGLVQEDTAPSEEVALETELGVIWLGQWVDEVVAYLENPAHPLIVEQMVVYLSLCPQPLAQEVVLEIAAQLLEKRDVSSDADTDADMLEPAAPHDVALVMENVDPELLHALLADAPQQLQVLEEAVRRWGEGAGSVADMLEAQRSAHTFKGSGNIIGLPGIGKVAHRLEDILEYAVEELQSGNSPHLPLVRDVTQAVYCLHQMVGFLQGEEAEPANSLAVLQRLLDWVGWLRAGEGNMANPEPLSEPLPQASAEDPVLALSSAHESGEAGTARTRDSGTLRVNPTQLGRMVRRAGQSVIHAERLSRILLDTDGWLAEMERNNQVLANRLRELDLMVNSQVVQLREAQVEGANFDPLELDRYDALHGLSRFISESARDSSELVKQARGLTGQSSALMRDESNALVEQHRELLTVRMVLVKSIVPRLRRIVAQTAGATARKVELKISGEDVAVDADVLNRLTEPLLHLLRNAVDHGIESPQDRAYAGKPEQGRINLGFQRVADEVVLTISDDGRGLDLVAIEAKAVEYGLIKANSNLSESELQRLILQAGFSTREAVTETSGRGVGMDIVNDRITGLKGRLDITSNYGQGCQFTLHVPVTSGVALALVVECAGEQVALAQDQIISIVAADLGEFSMAGSASSNDVSMRVDDVAYPAYLLANWLDFDAVTPEGVIERSSKWIAVLAKGVHGTIALLVDSVHSARELILQDVGRLTRRVPGIVGGALRPDGRPLFLVGITELERAAGSRVRLSSSKIMRKRLEAKRTLVLVVDDAWSVRRSMEQLLQDAGYEVATAGDGFEALDSLRLRVPALVITDLEMPNLNGLELTKRIREVPAWSDLPVVMITSRSSDKHRGLADAAGVNVYLTKPYQDNDLLDHVRRLAAQFVEVLDLAL